MKLPHIILLIILSVFSSCNHADINDASKRNENWMWWVDKDIGIGQWIPIGDKTTVKDGEFTAFYSNGKKFALGRLRNGKEVDTTYFYNYEGIICEYAINKVPKSSYYYPINGDYKSFYQRGEIREEGIVENHQWGSHWIGYLDNGKVIWKKLFTENNGWEMNYYMSGNIKDSTHYTNGIQDGIRAEWFESGQIRIIAHWKMDIQDGESIDYHENGNVAIKSHWKEGKQDGEVAEWYPDGHLRYVTHASEGKIDGKYVSYYEDGHLQWDYQFKVGIKDGPQITYYPNGNVALKITLRNGNQDGPKSKYYSNGQLGARGIMKKGRQEGIWEYYDSTGTKVKTEPASLLKELKSIP